MSLHTRITRNKADLLLPVVSPLSLVPLAGACLRYSHWCYIVSALYFTAVILLVVAVLFAMKCHVL